MIIDIFDKVTGDFHIRYESKICPSVGDTIELLKAFNYEGHNIRPFKAIVKERYHLLKPSFFKHGEVVHELTTLFVEI